MKTKPIELCYVHLGKIDWANALVVLAADARKLQVSTTGAFVEVRVLQRIFDINLYLAEQKELYAPVAPFTMKINPSQVASISEIRNAVVQDEE